MTAAPRRDSRPRFVDATGTRRRINALHAIGWTGTTLGRAYPRGPVSKQRVHQWRTAARVTAETRDAWAALYEQLRDTPGPCAHSRILALRTGHQPPTAWAGVDIDNPRAQPNPTEDAAA